MDVEASRNTEIAARLERAIQSGLPSSSSQSPSLKLEPKAERASSLSDLLLHVLHVDPEDRFSQICLAYSVSPLHQPKRPLHPLPPLSFTSSLAYQHLVESLHIDGLEPDLQEAEALQLSESEVDALIDKETSKPISTREENRLLSHSDPVYANPKSLNVEKKPEASENDIFPTQANITSTTEMDAIPSLKTENFVVENDGKHPSILDYTSKLEGISLDDFFSNPMKSKDTDSRRPDTVSEDGGRSIESTPIISVQKDSFFLDPLTDSIIPDGSDLFSYTSGSDIFPKINSEAPGSLLNNTLETMEDDGDDPFSSWEGEFQSAKAEVTSTSWFESQQHSSGDGEQNDMFGNSSKRAEVATADDDWGTGWVGSSSTGNDNISDLRRDNPDVISLFPGNGLVSGPQVDMDHTLSSLSPSINLHTEDLNTLSFFPSTTHIQPTSQRDIDVDSLMFGSGALQDNTQKTGFRSESGLELNGDDLFHSSPMVVNVRYGDGLQTDTTQFGEKSDMAVGALLAQLHDLSFMLSDTLAIKGEDLGSFEGGNS